MVILAGSYYLPFNSILMNLSNNFKRVLLAVLFLFVMKTTSFAQVSPLVEAELQKLGITPPTQPGSGMVIGAVRVGNLIFLSGHGPDKPDGTQIVGKVGADLTLEEGQEAARLTAIALLKTLKAQVGSFDKVKRIVKVLGMVNSAPDFTQQPQVINAFSELMVAAFGQERGSHARSAVGMAGLPSGIAVEIEMIVEVE